VEPGGGRGAAEAGAGPWAQELDGDKQVYSGSIREIVPAAVVQPALAGGGAPPVLAGRGRCYCQGAR